MKLQLNSRAAFLIIYQAALLVCLPFYFYYTPPSWPMVFASFVLFWLSGISITAGYHRYFSHRSFKTNSFIESLLLFFGSLAIQGSVLRWAFDHREHHAYVDSDKDPYSINKGFLYAHFLWIMDEQREIDPKVVPDLMKNKLVMLQHKYALSCMTGSNLLIFFFLGWLLNDYLGAFVIGVFARLFFLHHFTWFINSLAHTWGDKPFCQEQSAVDNFIISLVTFGEGYHNYHHTYANDYRNGVRWYHFDPSKWLIWTLSKLGLAYGLKKMDPTTISQRMIVERKNLLSSYLQNLWYIRREEVEQKIEEISNRIIEKTRHFKTLKENYYQFKQKKTERDILQSLKKEIKNLRKSIHADWNLLSHLSKNIMRLQPLKENLA
jgi:stearoyl-CoA desaturase (Delta-9 desaturase)